MGNYKHKIKNKNGNNSVMNRTKTQLYNTIGYDISGQRHYKHQKQTDIYHIEAVPISLLLINDNNNHISSHYTDIIQIGTTL